MEVFMNKSLQGKVVAILATDGFEQSELESPKAALLEAGAMTKIISLRKGKIKGWENMNWGKEVQVDETVEQARPEHFDALVLPGGVMNPDKLRDDQNAVAFIKSFVDDGKPIAAICHGPWTLINADAVRGRKVTSYSSIRADLENAGAQWVDQEVVTDKGLVTSRQPSDLPAFNRKMIEEIGEGVHQR